MGGGYAPAVELVRYEDADYSLTVALESDPNVMRELGGPTDPEALLDAHGRRMSDPWWFKIVPEPGGPPAGEIGIWSHELDGVTIHEVGWMVLPAFQGRGLATAALELLIERVETAPAVDSIHAFPGVNNAPSNALCRKFGFSLLGARDFVYRGRTLRCNHWTLATSSAAA